MHTNKFTYIFIVLVAVTALFSCDDDSDDVISSLDTPTGLSVTSKATRLVISWTEVDNATSYTVEYKEESVSDYTVKGSTSFTVYSLNDLASGTTYDIRVKATVGSVESAYASISATTTGSQSSSTSESEISTADEFVTWLEGVDDDTTGEYVLANDIDMSGVTITSAVDFAGTLDGQGYSIKNLESEVPLFESIAYGGIVKNLVIDESCSFTPSDYVFAPIVKINDGTVSACINNAEIAYTYSPSTVRDAALIAGIAAISYGSVTGCVNNGDISVTSSGCINGAPSGVVAYLGGEISDCTNNGTISLTALYADQTVNIYNSAVNGSSSVGGVVSYGEAGYSMSGCTNYGTINYTHTAVENVTSYTPARMMIGGVVGNPIGETSNCNNYGAVNVKAVTSDRSSVSSVPYIINVGGISGGDYLSSSTPNASPITSCNNYGDITVDFDSTNSNSTVGGIVGWAGVESTAQTITVTDCTNSGTVTVSGSGKGRVGGVAGGSTNLVSCKNTGDVVIESINSGSYIGALIGYHSYSHSVTDCTAEGSVTTKCTVTAMGGLIGSNGDKDGSFGSGCSVDCTLTDESGNLTSKTVGMVVGRINGNSGVITIGTSESPVTVAGSILGTTLTSSNYSSHIVGTTNYTTSVHTIYASYGGE